MLYAWEEDYVKINVVCGEQEQEEQQGLFTSSSGTGSSGNISKTMIST